MNYIVIMLITDVVQYRVNIQLPNNFYNSQSTSTPLMEVLSFINEVYKICIMKLIIFCIDRLIIFYQVVLSLTIFQMCLYLVCKF